MGLLKNKGAKKIIELPVSAPFHCDLMNSAKFVMKDEIMNTNFNEPIIPIVQNTTVEQTTDVEAIKMNLIDQVTETVRWRETMLKFIDLGVDVIIEVVQNVLTNLAKEMHQT